MDAACHMGKGGIFRFQGCCSRAAVGLKLIQLGIKKSILDSDPGAGIRNRNFCHAVTGKSGMPHN
jgi:hypothetical protein